MSTRTDLLIEVGAEEIPHRFLPDAVEALRNQFARRLEEAALAAYRVTSDATPRRLVVRIEGAPARQEDRTEELVGPPVEQAFKDGAPTKAAEGFAKKAGVDVAQLRRVATDKGERVAATRQVAGRPVEDVVAEIASDVFTRMDWPKNMRWGDGRRQWVRPVHWIVALSGEREFPIEILGVKSGRDSRGHRTLHCDPVRVSSAASYAEQLRSARVMVARADRRRAIEEGLEREGKRLGARVTQDDALVETCCDLVEWPVVVAGEFPAGYLELPEIVLTTAMRHHQRYFALTDEGGKLLPRFLHVAGKEDPDGVIARNNAAVLVARLDDATFYWKADLARDMASRNDELARVLFQEKLGSYLEKVQRMERLSAQVAMLLDPTGYADDREVELLRQAVVLSKADQTTHVVKEFTELQGVMGAIFLRREGAPESVCEAVGEHYLPQALTDAVPQSRLGALLSIIDKLDTLVGCFGVGVIPTGSKDPFGLRRAAQGLLRVLLERSIDVSLPSLVGAAADQFDVAGFGSPAGTLLPYLHDRLRFLLTEGTALGEGGTTFPQDEVAAVLGASWDSMPDVLDRLRALHAVRHAERRDDFEALSIGFKRVRNILRGTIPHRLQVPTLVEPAEKALAEAVQGLSRAKHASRRAQLEALAGLRPHVDRFFDGVMVMVEDETLRNNRIALLQEIERLFLDVADISELAGEAAK